MLIINNIDSLPASRSSKKYQHLCSQRRQQAASKSQRLTCYQRGATASSSHLTDHLAMKYRGLPPLLEVPNPTWNSCDQDLPILTTTKHPKPIKSHHEPCMHCEVSLQRNGGMKLMVRTRWMLVTWQDPNMG